MNTLNLLFLAAFGLVGGSFIGAYTYRAPKNIKISKGRSFCPKCKKTIHWYDNIPLISFILLKGKCRFCKEPISFREPLVELAGAFLVILIFIFSQNISLNIPWLFALSDLYFPYILFIIFVMLAIFVTDIEGQVILDELTFLALLLTISALLISGVSIYPFLLSGFGAGLFLLLIHLFTFGRGMGLGDVKLAILVGTLFGPVLTLIFMFLSFLIGALTGIFLIALRKAKFGQKIAFGPFMVISFFLVLFFGSSIAPIIFPFF
jgi:leader peptidase (prepilin peptidase)/N-methyltransferase